MKHFKTLFDILLYEGIFVFLFGCLLYLLDDRYSVTFLLIAGISVIIAGILGVAGRVLHLFPQKNDFEER
jgi:hypothetical protein